MNFALNTAKNRLTKLDESRIPSSTGWVRSRVNFHIAPFLDLLPVGGLFCLSCDVNSTTQLENLHDNKII